MFTFIDVFAGCGGLSLGLMQAGGTGLFAIEKNAAAFETLSHNLVTGRGNRPTYSWPDWLPKTQHDVRELLKDHEAELIALRGTVDAVVGGPPCQGFSLNGERDSADPRNQLFRQYLKLVELVQPRMVLLENVRGIDIPFADKPPKQGPNRHKRVTQFSELIRKRLEAAGYAVFPKLLCAGDFGVPQLRPRFFLVGVSKTASARAGYAPAPFADIEARRIQYLAGFGLTKGGRVSVKSAISDLEIAGRELVDCVDSRGFKQPTYRGPRTGYQRQMHAGIAEKKAPNSMRLAKHRPETLKRFKKIQSSCRRGVQLSQKDRDRLGLLKHRTYPLATKRPAPTLTTLPDDVLHYLEPRILTVREYARLQSFPDWYEFKGPYTTGGERRRKTCPRYTQVGNAVPVRLARFLGSVLNDIARALEGAGAVQARRAA
jgi:DNA (cytosine-5)-methyltransferase 1